MISVDAASSVPPHEQVRQQLAGLIRSGELAAGVRLPPVRQLAGDLGLANGTVARAYKELEAAQLVSTARAAGTRVREGCAGGRELSHAARELVGLARAQGWSAEDLAGLIAAQWAHC